MGHERYSVRVCWGVRESEGTRGTKGGGDSIVGSNGTKILGMEIV